LPLHLPLRYRPLGEPAWTESVTQNISRTGVLFTADTLLGPETTIEIELHLPEVKRLHVHGGRIVSRARVVRTDGTGERTALAAAFLEYQFSPSED
jgi:hypothetical protein